MRDMWDDEDCQLYLLTMPGLSPQPPQALSISWRPNSKLRPLCLIHSGPSLTHALGACAMLPPSAWPTCG